MARLAGIELKDNQPIDFALTNIKGVGWSVASKVLEETGIKPKTRVKDITSDELSKLASALEAFPHEGDLVRQVRNNVSRLQTIGSYRGMRHSRGLPARGQRTKSNARTKRGKRKTVGSFRKEALTKMAQN